MKLQLIPEVKRENDLKTKSHSTPAPKAEQGNATAWLQAQRTHGNRYVQRALSSARQPEGEMAPETESAIEGARSKGQGLDQGVRRQMESAFGMDFGGVRIHTGGESHMLNRAVSAVAFTTGQDIFFRDGAYNPSNSEGRELLAHELTHVVQQGGASAAPGRTQGVQIQRLCQSCEEEKSKGIQHKLTMGQKDDPYEQEATQVAKTVSGILAGASIPGGKSSDTNVSHGQSGLVARSGAPQLQGSTAGVVGGAAGGAAVGGVIGGLIGGPVGAAIGAVGGAVVGGIVGGLVTGSKWSITQTNTDGPSYSSEVNITFTPDSKINCSEIAFVQAVKIADTSSGASFESRPNFLNRITAGGWTIDRIDGRSYGWYGYNNNGSPSGTVTPGSAPTPLRAATMYDKPGFSRPNTKWQFETCAICRAGTDASRIHGCYNWGFSVDAANHLTSLPNQETPAPSAEFAESINRWNVQAGGPTATRNDPAQHPLGPFR